MILRTEFSRRLRRLAQQEDGAVAMVVALMLPVMFGMVGLVEASRVYGVKNQLQTTADAAALASVRHVPTLTDVQSKATDFAHRNMPLDGQYGEVLSNVEMGHWDGDVFLSGSEPANAVRVTTLADMPLIFGAVLRSLAVEVPTSLKPSAEATALWRLDKCYLNGFVAGGTVEMNSQNTFAANFCVYGRSGVTMNNSNEFAPGTGVGMLNLNDLVEGGNNPGVQDALVQRDIAAPAPGEASQLIDDLLAGFGPRPDYLTTGPLTVNQLPSPPVPGTLYNVLDAGIELSGTHENIGIISEHPITVKSNSTLRNVLLASKAAVDIRANVSIGDSDFCATGAGTSLIISGGAVSDKDIPVGTNSNISLHGVQVVSDGNVAMNSNLAITGVSMQSTGNIKFNSSFAIEGCPDGTSPNVTGDGTMVAQLVD